MIATVPPSVVRIRESHCRGKCDVDPADPCVACPNGHWGSYVRAPAATIAIVSIHRRRSERANESRSTSIARPGDLLSWMIFKATGQKAANCGRCRDRIRQMNEWGWIQCFRNRRLIIAWLMHEASLRGINMSGQSAAALFRAAWREYRQTRRRQAADRATAAPLQSP